MKAQIISTGTELTIGQAVDTNAVWLSQQLAAIGIQCAKHVAVPDDRAAIAAAIAAASREAGLVLLTGGLGPTPDDVTRMALADALGVDVRLDEASLAQIEAFFRERHRPMRESNRCQAVFPIGADPIENTCGTAPGMHARLNDADIYVMPGVPQEMKVMFQRDVRPAITTGAAAGGAIILQRTLRTFGMPEAEIGEKLADLMERGRNPAVGTGAADLIISIRINARGATVEEARELLDADVAAVRLRMGHFVYGEGDDTLAHAAARLLAERRKTIATAESCTGGLIAKRLTDVSGSSVYFVQGFVTYANEAKHRLLGIPMDLIEACGAVSAEVAQAMAVNCRRLAGTDYALSATGIAGPTGGTPAKPVGLVFIGLAHTDGAIVKELRMGGTLPRDAIRDRTAKAALNLLRLHLIERE
jgi:nicotinamide-nucleotide amidase